MILASRLRPGVVVRFEGTVYKVLAAEYHAGQGKMGGVAHARLRNLGTGTLWEHGFRAELKLEDLPLEKRSVEFLYQDGDECFFLAPENDEYIAVPASLIGEQMPFLRPDTPVTLEYVDGRPVSVALPEIMEIPVAETAPPVHQQQDSTWKAAVLDNGIEIMVPQFIKVGDVIRLDVSNLHYMDRARHASK